METIKKISDTQISIPMPTPADQIFTLDQINDQINIWQKNFDRAKTELDKWQNRANQAITLGVKTQAEIKLQTKETIVS